MAVDLSSAERRQMGDRLRAARTVANLSSREVADATGRSKTAVESWERHGYLPPDHARPLLAHLYGVPEAALFVEYETHLAAARALLPTP